MCYISVHQFERAIACSDFFVRLGLTLTSSIRGLATLLLLVLDSNHFINMPEASVNHKTNLILNALPPQEYVRLSNYLEYVELPVGKTLYEPEEQIRHAYFPLQGAVSIVTVFRDGGSVEAGVVGNEGIVGIPLLLGTEMELDRRAQVQIAGSGLRLKAPRSRMSLDGARDYTRCS
jgi:hypothetical protein